MELKNGFKTLHPKSRTAWRKWLEKHHEQEEKIWLAINHKKNEGPGLHYEEAVEEALCYGWIDSTASKRDDQSFYVSFSRRKAKSPWSKSNRIRVEKLISAGQMTPAGMKMIEQAKKAGTWTILDDIDNAGIPDDLMKEFKRNKVAFTNFNSFPPSSRRLILGWISNAKRPETRKKRIDETVKLAAQNIRANH